MFKVSTIGKGVENAGHEGAEGFACHKRWRARVVKRSELSGGGCIAQISIKALDDGVDGALNVRQTLIIVRSFGTIEQPICEEQSCHKPFVPRIGCKQGAAGVI